MNAIKEGGKVSVLFSDSDTMVKRVGVVVGVANDIVVVRIEGFPPLLVTADECELLPNETN